MAGKSTKFENNPVMDYSSFLGAANKAKAGYDKKADTNQKDKDGKLNDEELSEANGSGSQPKEQAQKAHSDKEMSDKGSKDKATPDIKKFTSKYLSSVKKKDIVDKK